MQDYKKLKVWEISMSFVEDIYRITSNFPRKEIFGISNQLKRAVISIPANISEGTARSTDKDFLNFLRIALGSANESSTYIELCKRINYISQNEFTELNSKLEYIKVMLIKLINKIKFNDQL